MYFAAMAGSRFAFGPFVLDAEAGTLARQGVPVPIAYRGQLILAALVGRPGEVLSKSDLLEAGWPGMAVEEGNLTVQVAALRRLLGPAPEGGEWIATVPRVGYRFAGRIQAPEAAGSPAPESPDAGPSIAVLPFENSSPDSEQQYFADGLAEEIITRLARLRWLFVSARNSSFTYRGRAVDVRQVGRELGVRYVLDGSVRRSGQRLRILAGLSEAATGRQVWSERYDVELADFFALQDQIAESVGAALEPRLYAAEHERFESSPPDSLDAWGFVMKAMPHVWTWGSQEDIDIAHALLRRAIELDPDYPRAHSLLAWIHAARVQLGWAVAEDVLPTAREAAQRAIRRDPEDPWTHFAAGYVHMVSRRFDAAVAELSLAIQLNSSLAFAHVILGSTYAYGGMSEDGLHHAALAVRLSPRDFTQAGNFSVMGLCHFMAGRFAEGADLQRQAVELRPHFGTAWRTYAASAGMAGDMPAAARALQEARRLHPSLSVDWVERYHPIVHERDRALYIEGLRRAGLR
jgi:TolB-like protein/Tfp pilus assembly protein PilF